MVEPFATSPLWNGCHRGPYGRKRSLSLRFSLKDVKDINGRIPGEIIHLWVIRNRPPHLTWSMGSFEHEGDLLRAAFYKSAVSGPPPSRTWAHSFTFACSSYSVHQQSTMGSIRALNWDLDRPSKPEELLPSSVICSFVFFPNYSSCNWLRELKG